MFSFPVTDDFLEALAAMQHVCCVTRFYRTGRRRERERHALPGAAFAAVEMQSWPWRDSTETHTNRHSWFAGTRRSAAQRSQQLRSSFNWALAVCIAFISGEGGGGATQPNQCRICWKERLSMKPEPAPCPQQTHFTICNFGFCMFGKKLLLTETYFELPKL